jgi:FAD/FMN-containing dehydrogenase
MKTMSLHTGAPDIARAVQLLEPQLSAGAILTEPGSTGGVSRVWNARVSERPAVVARCHTTSDVQAAVRAAASAEMPVSVLAGGHDWSGSAIRDRGLLIDLSDMRDVQVVGSQAEIGGGATVSDLLDAARIHGLAAAVGTVGSVGMAGLTMGGGYGPLVGTLGLAVDNLLSAEVVLGDGRVVTANADHEPDLFWALRGGGGNFGVVTQLRTRLHPLTDVTTGTIAFGLGQGRAVLEGWRELTRSADDALDVMFGAMDTPAGRVLFTAPTWGGDPHNGESPIAQVRALGNPVLDDVGPRALADTVHALDEAFPAGRNYHLAARLLPGLTDRSIDAFLKSAEEMPSTCVLNVHHCHGAAIRVPVAATAHAYRDEHLVVEILGVWDTGDGSAEIAWVQDTERRLDTHALAGGWTNLMARGDPRAQDAYGPNTERLLSVKARYDPDGMFSAIPIPRQQRSTR